MELSDRIDFISRLELKRPQAEFRVRKTRSLASNRHELVAEGKEQAFLTDKSIVSFVSQVNAQSRKDVLNSTLLAQMAANKKFPDEKDLLQWYHTFIGVLSRIGWNIEAKEFTPWESNNNIIEVESIVIDILTTAFGANYLEIIKKTLNSIKQLSEGNSNLQVFETNTHSLSKGCFQLGLAVEENDTVSLQLGTFFLTSTNEIRKILFLKTTKDKTRLEYASRQGTLNKEVYAQVRNQVLEKLGVAVKTTISEIEI